MSTLGAADAIERWRGVVIPLVTPFTPTGSPDVSALAHNVEWLLERGARQGNSVFLAAGSGGDFPMMSLDERRSVIATVASASRGLVPVIASAQALDLRDVLALCQCADEHGVDAVQIAGPSYYDGRPEDAISWLTKVASETQVGFAIYNNWYTGYDMPLDLVERLLALPNTVGVKWASPSIETFIEGVHRLHGRVAVINNTLVSVFGHMLGCGAFVSHWPNFFPEFAWTLSDLMEARRYAEAHTYFEDVMRPYRGLVSDIASKTAGEGVFVRPFMNIVGLPAGASPLPSRDEVITPLVRERAADILANARDLTEGVRLSLSQATETAPAARL